MDNFLNNLYSYDNFGIYLIIAIVILVILFFLILFFGKKDKKNRELEETKRLQKLNPDLFKMDDEKDKVESIEENKIEEEVKPIINEEESIKDTKPEIIKENISENNEDEEIKPILTKEEEKPLIIEEEPIQIEEAKEEELPEIPAYNPVEITKDVEEIKEENKEVEVAKEEKEKLEKITTPNVEVFSSVYVPKEEKEEIPKVEEEKPIIDNEDDEFELPALKTDDEEETEISVPQKQDENNSFSNVDLDSITGESYNINK